MTWAEIAAAAYTAAKTDPKFEDLRDYLKAEEDDDRIIHECCATAIEYVRTAVGEFDEDDPTAVMLMYALAESLYDERILKDAKASNTQPFQRMAYVYQSIILQLQMKYAAKQEEAIT